MDKIKVFLNKNNHFYFAVDLRFDILDIFGRGNIEFDCN